MPFPEMCLRAFKLPSLLTLLLCCSLLKAGEQADLPKFGGSTQKYWMDACARCHGVNGNGRDNDGRPLPNAGFDFTDSRYANRRKDAHWIQAMLNGQDKMPAFKEKMSEADAKKMIAEVLRKFAAKH